MGTNPPPQPQFGPAPNRWGVASRPTLIFVTAFALSVTPHEVAHALTGYCLGFNSTLFQMWVNSEPAVATPTQRAIIAAAGPIFSLALGVASWLLYRRLRQAPSGLLFLMMAIIGTYSFLGPLVGAAFGGDFNLVFTLLGLPTLLRSGFSVMGVLLLSSFMFLVGRELAGWAPTEFSRAQAVACTTVAPWLIGTPLTLLAYWPLPRFLVASTLAGSIFWVFAVFGARFGPSASRHPGRNSSITRTDLIATILALAMVRFLATGVDLAR
jgi:hypothetical protein